MNQKEFTIIIVVGVTIAFFMGFVHGMHMGGGHEHHAAMAEEIEVEEHSDSHRH